MKKSICLCVGVLVICLQLAAQCGSKKSKGSEKPGTYVKSNCSKSDIAKYKSSKNYNSRSNSFQKSKLIPYIESSYQLGLCGEYNPVAFTAGVEKPLAKHISIQADVQYWKTKYEIWCCDTYSKGNYSSFIPSVKIKLDPGKPNKGFFIGAGIGYAVAKDRGTEQKYTETSGSGIKTFEGDVVKGNWDFNTVAPSFNWGFTFKVHRLPISVIQTNYFGNSTYGWGPLATGVGARVGLAQVAKTTKSSKAKKSCTYQRSGCGKK